MEIKKLTTENIEDIKFIIKETFSREPWNDDWSNEQQFHLYILDLIEMFIRKKDIVGIVLFTEKEIPAYGLYVKKGFEERKERVFFERRIDNCFTKD